MNKEIEEAIERLNNFRTIKVLYGNNFIMHLEKLNQVQQDIETALNYIKDSTPNSVIREKKKDLEKKYKQALEENSTKAFILKCQLEILEEILKKGEK